MHYTLHFVNQKNYFNLKIRKSIQPACSLGRHWPSRAICNWGVLEHHTDIQGIVFLLYLQPSPDLQIQMYRLQIALCCCDAWNKWFLFLTWKAVRTAWNMVKTWIRWIVNKLKSGVTNISLIFQCRDRPWDVKAVSIIVSSIPIFVPCATRIWAMKSHIYICGTVPRPTSN